MGGKAFEGTRTTLIETLEVYGFGSFFDRASQPQDIDLLLLHRSADADSCQFAIKCKAQIKIAIPNADVIMLSQKEADSLEFSTRANIILLGKIDSGRFDASIQTVIEVIWTIAKMSTS